MSGKKIKQLRRKFGLEYKGNDYKSDWRSFKKLNK